MTTPRRLTVPRVAAAIVAAAALGACASQDPTAAGGSRDAETRVVLSDSRWLDGRMEPNVAPQTSVVPRSVRANTRLDPTEPWIGTIGLRSALSKYWEFGLGVCVPNPTSGREGAAPVLADRVRELGVGIWLKFDF
jgi:hypothetical protein